MFFVGIFILTDLLSRAHFKDRAAQSQINSHSSIAVKTIHDGFFLSIWSDSPAF